MREHQKFLTSKLLSDFSVITEFGTGHKPTHCHDFFNNGKHLKETPEDIAAVEKHYNSLRERTRAAVKCLISLRETKKLVHLAVIEYKFFIMTGETKDPQRKSWIFLEGLKSQPKSMQLKHSVAVHLNWLKNLIFAK